MTVTNRKWISLMLALMLVLGAMPAWQAAASGQSAMINLLAADMDTGFDGGTSPFTLDGSSSGGSQQMVQVNGNHALEFRDASLGSNVSSYFYYQLSSGTLKDRINQIYNRPVGSAPVDFVFEYKLRRSAASDKPVAKDIYAQLQFGNYDNNLIPRFPAGTPSISGTAAYLNSTPDVLQKVNDADLPGYRFQIIPNGGQRNISSVKLGFSVRVDTGGTDEAYIVDDLAVYEDVQDGVEDNEAPAAPSNLTSPGKTDTSVNLSWTASTDNIGVTRYDIYQNDVLAGSVGGTATSYSAVGLSPNTLYRYTVKARDAAGNLSAASSELSVTTLPSVNGLPEPFGDRDIGSVAVAGSASYTPETGTFKVKGSGNDIWGTADAFHYVYRPWTGDGQMIARVSKLENTVAWTKAGIMIRGNISEQSPHAMMAVTPANGVVFEDRLLAGGASTLTTGTAATAPYWVKLARAGNVISAYYSNDGTNWTLTKKEQINLPQTVYFGLALTSHENNRLSTAEFDHVSVEPIPPSESTSAPFPGTIETRRDWLWNKTKTMSEIGGQLNIVQLVAQILDGQNKAVNLQKLDTMFQTYDWEQYKTVSKMYAYLMVGDQFDSAMIGHVREYFAKYAYAKLPQTENLRMSNYTAGYLVGQYFPDLADLNGVSGAALKSSNRANIEEMVEAGVHSGWAEYESPEYTFMTYLCLNALYQYSDEADFRQKIKMAMDVMWFEWANDWIDGTFISTTSRAKGDSVSASDPSWRGTDHTALSWMYFGAHRAQESIGESDAMVPSAYRPYLEFLGMVLYRGMDYTPPVMAVQIGQTTDKNYTSRKTNLQNSSGRNLKTYRQAYVKPAWGLATEVTYNRVDNWIEDIPVALRWLSPAPDSLFRLSVDQGDSPIGNYDQPENHRIMQDGKAAVGVYKSLGGPNATDNYINAMFPDTGSILNRQEQSGWVFSETGPMYFAFKMMKPYSWYYQTPTDPANKVKTTTQLHPTKQLSYSYNILRSRADKNGWVLETADASEYADFASFKNAVLTNTNIDSSHIDEANPRLIYTNLSGRSMDITFDLASGSYSNTHQINGSPIPYSSFKLFDTPYLQQDQNADLFTASLGGETLTYNFANWTVTGSGEAVPVPNSGFEEGTASPDDWAFSVQAGSPAGAWDSTAAKSGEHSVKITGTDSADQGEWNLKSGSKVAVQPGNSYTLKASVKTNAVNATYGAYAALTFYKADGTTVTGSTYFSDNQRGTNDWIPIEVKASPPSDAVWAGLALGLKGSGTAWFDDAALFSQQLVAVTGVTLNTSALSLGVGKSADLKALIQPVEATDKRVIWSSDYPSIAAVDASGKVTGAAPGTAVITATTADGGFSAACAVTVALEPLFQDSFAGGLSNWDFFGSTAWQIQGSGTQAQLKGTTSAGSPQRAVVKASALPYSSGNYSMAFTASGDRFRTMFRYASGTSYYFLEFKNTKELELWKYANSSTPEQVGSLVDIGNVIPGFNLTDWHDYKLDVRGDVFKLYVDGMQAAAFTDNSLTAGGVGFSVKSVGPAANLTVDSVTVMP